MVVAGWECRGGALPINARWFAIRLTPVNSPWMYCRGEPYRVIAALELYATLFGVVAFMSSDDQWDGSAAITGSASTDNKGNAYAAAKLMTTKFPLNAMVMELSEQLEARRSWLKLDWVPRHQNEEADALTNGEYGGFRPELRIDLDPGKIKWIILTEILELGGGLLRELEAKKLLRKASRQAAKEAKKRRKLAGETLRERDPW